MKYFKYHITIMITIIFRRIFTFSALALENPIYRRVSRGDRFCRCIFVGVGFFLGGKAAIVQFIFYFALT